MSLWGRQISFGYMSVWDRQALVTPPPGADKLWLQIPLGQTRFGYTSLWGRQTCFGYMSLWGRQGLVTQLTGTLSPVVQTDTVWLHVSSGETDKVWLRVPLGHRQGLVTRPPGTGKAWLHAPLEKSLIDVPLEQTDNVWLHVPQRQTDKVWYISLKSRQTMCCYMTPRADRQDSPKIREDSPEIRNNSLAVRDNSTTTKYAQWKPCLPTEDS